VRESITLMCLSNLVAIIGFRSSIPGRGIRGGRPAVRRIDQLTLGGEVLIRKFLLPLKDHRAIGSSGSRRWRSSRCNFRQSSTPLCTHGSQPDQPGPIYLACQPPGLPSHVTGWPPPWLSRPGARCRCCHRAVSPGRSPNPPCVFPRSGLSTLSTVRRGLRPSRGWGSCCPGSGTA
jgi:hypothetical protein